MPAITSTLDAPRTLIVVDHEDSGRAIAASLGDEFAATLRICARPDQLLTETRAHRADVVVFGLASLEAVELNALALLGPGVASSDRPFVLALCDSANVRFAASLCKQGTIDDYVLHFPTPIDPDRLATTLRLAGRVVALGAAAAAAPPAPTQRRPVVLVVEDDEVLHHLVAAMLDTERVELVFESDGAAAFDRIRAVGPDLVLMDVLLPGADGVALTQRMKDSPDLAAIPVVMLTGEARLETLIRSMEAGAADFIVKPFTREALVAKLSKYLPVAA